MMDDFCLLPITLVVSCYYMLVNHVHKSKCEEMSLEISPMQREQDFF